MGLVKALIKITLLLAAAAAVAAVVTVVKRSKSPATLSYDQWPEVPRNPSA